MGIKDAEILDKKERTSKLLRQGEKVIRVKMGFFLTSRMNFPLRMNFSSFQEGFLLVSFLTVFLIADKLTVADERTYLRKLPSRII